MAKAHEYYLRVRELSSPETSGVSRYACRGGGSESVFFPMKSPTFTREITFQIPDHGTDEVLIENMKNIPRTLQGERCHHFIQTSSLRRKEAIDITQAYRALVVRFHQIFAMANEESPRCASQYVPKKRFC